MDNAEDLLILSAFHAWVEARPGWYSYSSPKDDLV